MSKAQVIDYIEEVKKLTPIVQEQINLLEQFSKQHAMAYKALPSEYLKQQREQLALEKENERLKRETIKTTEQLEVLAKKQIQTAQANQRLQVQQAREAERLEKASERKANAVIKESSAYLQLQRRWREAQRTLADLIITQGKGADATKRAQAEFNKLDTKLRSVDVAVKNYSRNVGNYSSALVGLGKQLAGALGWAGALTTIVALGKSFYDTTKQLQVVNKTMELGSKDAQTYASNISFLNDITQKYGLELISTTQAYNKFYIASKNKLALEEIQLIFDKVSKSASLMGMSMYDQEGVFKALEQMMSKGTVQAEELRMQLGDRLPGAFETMAKAVGVSTAELGDMMKRGEVIASEVLPQFAIELEKAFGADKIELVENLVASENNLTNAWTNFVKSVNEGSSEITTALMSIYNGMASVIDFVTNATKTREQITKESTDSIIKWTNETVDAEIEAIKRGKKARGESFTQEEEDALKLQKTHELVNIRRSQLQGQLFNLNEKLAKQEEKSNKVIAINRGAIKKQMEETLVSIKQVENQIDSLGKFSREYKPPTAIVPDKIVDKNAEKEAEKQRKLREKEAEKARLQAEKDAEERSKLDFQIRQTELSNRIEQNKRVAELNASSSDELIVIQTDYLMAKLELLELEYQEEIRLAGGNEQKLELARIKHNEAMLQLTDEATKLTVEANKKMYDDIDKKAEEANKEAEKKALEKLELIKKHLQEYTDLTKFGFGSLNTFFNGEFDKLLDAAKGTSAEIAVYANVIGDVMKDMYSALTASSDAYFTQQFENLEKEKELAIKFAGENTAGREAIEQQYEEKKRAIQRQQAKQQKETAIFNAMINIAQGVTSALAQAPPASFILAGLVGALGAIQIGTIASTPLPQYYTGTDNAKEGWAWTQERGAEVITDKKGNIKTMGHNKGATLTMMSAGDKVYKNHDEFFKAQEQDFNQDLNDVLMSSGIAPILKVENNGISKEEMLEVLSQTLGKQPKNSLNIDEKGFNLYNEKQNARQLNRNRNVRI